MLRWLKNLFPPFPAFSNFDGPLGNFCPRCGIPRINDEHNANCTLCGDIRNAKYSRHTGIRGTIGRGNIMLWGRRSPKE